MSRFNSTAYDKLFPRVEDPAPVETVVSTFTPTTDKLEGKDPDQDKILEVPAAPDPAPAPEDEGGDTDGYAEHSKPDSE